MISKILKLLKSKVFTYICFILAFCLLGVGYLGILPNETCIALAGLLGFSGVNGIRNFIESKGIKSYILNYGGILISILALLGWITPDIQIKLQAFIGSLIGATIQQALSKQNK